VTNASTAVEAQQRVEKSAFAIAEAYPDLKANENFLGLQRMLEDTEDRVALARSFYNDSINILLDRKGTFPYIFLTPMLSIPSYQLFAADYAAREYVPRIDMAGAPTVGSEQSPTPTEGNQ
jgi:LemA protein